MKRQQKCGDAVVNFIFHISQLKPETIRSLLDSAMRKKKAKKKPHNQQRSMDDVNGAQSREEVTSAT